MATIFIVDDDQAIGEMLSLVLENEGFQTVTCLGRAEGCGNVPHRQARFDSA